MCMASSQQRILRKKFHLGDVMETKKQYVLVHNRLWFADFSGNLIEDITEQNHDVNLDPVILASILKNLGREMTLSSWYWRTANYLTERLDIKLKHNSDSTEEK